jgi:glyoxylase-like metal-dependent hydrolase (beta-lactamase superfamily II)
MNIVNNKTIKITKMALGPFQTNAYIVVCQKTHEGVIIDAPGESNKIIKSLGNAIPKMIVITHSHMDHIGALSELKSMTGAPIAIHPGDAPGLSIQPDIELNDGEIINIGQLAIRVIHTPGHTEGGICLLVEDYLIAGDTVFPGGPGRTSSAARFKQLLASITTRIIDLPDSIEVLPGHGDNTTMKDVKEEFAVFSSKPHDPNLHGDVLWETS